MQAVGYYLQNMPVKVTFFRMQIPCLLIQETSESLSSTAFDSSSDGIPGLDHPLTMPIIIKDNEADAAAPICNNREKQIHQFDSPFCGASNE